MEEFAESTQLVESAVEAGHHVSMGEAESFLQSVGFDVKVDTEDGTFWASLRSRSNPEFSVPKYGRGSSAAEAVEGAAQRWKVEQIGTRASGPRWLP